MKPDPMPTSHARVPASLSASTAHSANPGVATAAGAVFRGILALARADLWQAALAVLALGLPAAGQSGIAGWGDQAFNSSWNDEHFVEVSAGGEFTLSRRADGSLAVWGQNTNEQCELPALPPGLSCVQIDAGGTCGV